VGVLVWLGGSWSDRPGLEEEYLGAIDVTLGRAGVAGEGGGGARAGGDGDDGILEEVLVR
jgi:hypothetical protein